MAAQISLAPPENGLVTLRFHDRDSRIFSAVTLNADTATFLVEAICLAIDEGLSGSTELRRPH